MDMVFPDCRSPASMPRLSCLIAACLATFLPTTARADMIIENFSTAQSFSLAAIQSSAGVSGVGILGGQRDVELRRGATETVTFNAAAGQAVVSSSGVGNHLSTRMFITWDGNLVGISPNANLLADGSSNFIISGVTNSIDMLVTLQVTATGAVGSTARTLSLTANNTATDIVIPFSSFVGFSTIFTQVEAIQFSITPQDNSPFTFTMGSVITGDISAVPEPTSLAIAGLAAVAGLGWRRRNIRKNVPMSPLQA